MHYSNCQATNVIVDDFPSCIIGSGELADQGIFLSGIPSNKSRIEIRDEILRRGLIVRT